MVCLGLEPRVAGLKARTNPLCYGGTPLLLIFKRTLAHPLPLPRVLHLSKVIYWRSEADSNNGSLSRLRTDYFFIPTLRLLNERPAEISLKTKHSWTFSGANSVQLFSSFFTAKWVEFVGTIVNSLRTKKKSTYLVEMSLHLYSLISPAKSLGVLCYNRYCKNLNNHVGELSVLIFSYVSKWPSYIANTVVNKKALSSSTLPT